MYSYVLEAMGNKTMMMGQFFFFTDDMKNFLFHGLNIHETSDIIITCLIIIALAVCLEGLRSLTVYLRLRLKQNPLTYGRTDISINHDRIQFHISGFFLHTVNLLVGYLLMLAVMSYNAYIMLAVIVGSGLGYFIFGAVTARNQAKFAQVHQDIYDSRMTLNDSQITDVG